MIATVGFNDQDRRRGRCAIEYNAFLGVGDEAERFD